MGLKKNIVYNSLLTCSLYLFQLITYPYVARVLGVNNIGICNYVQSIVYYFILFATLGISTLGVREIAKCNGDKAKLSETFSRIFSLNIYFTLLALIVYFICIEAIPQLAEYKRLLYIGAVQILLNLFLIEWFFKGIENFKYITIRTIIIRILYIFSVFIFIRNENDYDLFFILSTALVVASALTNWTYGTRFVEFRLKSIKKSRIYAKPVFFIGSQLILTSMYTTLNVAFLGFMCGDTEVGYYTTATKIQNIILALYSAFTLAMMPRISSLSAQGNMDAIKQLIDKSFNLLYAFALPTIILVEFFAPEITHIVAGSGYDGAILPLRIVMPLILIIGLEQILIFQILLPLRKDKAVFINALIGALIGIIFNLILVSSFKSIGSSFVWIFAELSVFACAVYFVKKEIGYTIKVKNILRYIASYLPATLVCFLILLYMPASGFAKFAASTAFMLVYCHLDMYYWIKDPVYSNFLNQYIKPEQK